MHRDTESRNLRGEMARLSIGVLGLTELFVSTAVHVLFGFYIFSTAVASDLSQVLTDCLKPNVFGLGAKEMEEQRTTKEKVAVLEGSPPPIVLVHGIFGFGKGVFFACPCGISLMLKRVSPFLQWRLPVRHLIAEAWRFILLCRRGEEG